MGQQTSVELAVGSEFAGYRIEELSARGGMGVVYRASQLRLTRMVALKLVSPGFAHDEGFRERFRREWMIAASIDHPNVIPVYEAGEADGILFIAMRWVEGGTNLRGIIDHGPLEPARAVHIVSQVASALDAAHARDLVHRDVKPANILVTGHDHVYLTDFGLTKHASSISGLTRTGQWVGTVDYTAPEQIEGAQVCPQTDVYSLGCVLYEALTGRAPHARDNELATLWAHVYTEPPSVREVAPNVPEELDTVVRRAMAKDPAERYPSAGALGSAALEAVLGPDASARHTVVPPPAPPDAPPPAEAAAPKGPRRFDRRLIYGVVGALLVAAAIVAAVLISGSDEPKTNRAASATPTVPPSSSSALRPASTWRPLASLPTAVQNNTGTVLDGTAWVVGGLSPGTKATRRTQGYDPVINSWKAGPNLPKPLHHEVAVTYKDGLIVIGGWIPEGSDPSAITTGRVYALRGSRWVQLPSLNQPRAAGAAAVVGDKIVVVGGQADGKLVRTTEVFDGNKWETKSPMPTPREHLAAASDGKYVYVVGGRNLGPDKNSAALERYDPATDTWERLPHMPTARGGLGAAIVGGHLVAIGGETPTDVLGKVESYNPASKRWTRAPSLRDPRHGVVLLAIGRSLYAFGGGRKPGHDSATDTAQVLRLTH